MATDTRQGDIFLFAGGGTGGHLYPGLAVAEEVLRLRPGAKIVFACSDRPIDRRILDPLPYAVIPQPVKPLPRGAGGWCSFARAWMESAALAKDMVHDLKPVGVLGLGGFAAGPVVKQAARAGVRAALLNPDAVPGKANRYLARRVNVIFTQFDATRECFPAEARGKVRRVGCPIRSGIAPEGDGASRSADAADPAVPGLRRDEAIRHFGLRPHLRTLLVLGGSLGAATINGAVDLLADAFVELADRWQALHVAGPGCGEAPAEPAGGPRATAAAGGGGMLIRRLEYCQRMDLAYAAADLALCRAGAVTVAELSATATPAVLMPYPFHKDRQQFLNAAGLEASGAAVLCEDSKDARVNAERLREVLIPLMKDAGKLEKMRQAARERAGARAASDVAEWLVGGGA